MSEEKSVAAPPEKPRTRLEFAPIEDTPEGVDQAWADLQLSLLLSRHRLKALNEMRGGCGATRAAFRRLEESIFWLLERPSNVAGKVGGTGG